MPRSCASIPLLFAVLACGSSSDTIEKRDAPTPLPPLVSVTTTLDRTIVPTHAIANPADKREAYDVASRNAMVQEGFGAFTFGAGEARIERVPPGMTAAAKGPNAKLLTRFVHMPDLQLADDESPARFTTFDNPDLATGAYRPQEIDGCRIVNAAVRTVNALHAATPIDFLLLGGDNADNAQTNEVGWVLDVLGGAKRIECDSGNDDDPTPGPGNDGKDPFVAEGLRMPFYWVNGNHDVLVQGNFTIDENRQSTAVGDTSVWGAPDYRKPGGPLITEGLIADTKRRHLYRNELMQRVLEHGNGHGLSAKNVETGKANYTFDVANGAIRFVIVDTTATTGGAEGLLRRSDIDSFVKPTLDQAKADGKMVILASHHAVSSLTNGGSFGGEKQADAISQDEWLDVLGGYPNLLFSMVGHAHRHRVTFETPATGHGYWEVMTSALADFPHQIRLVEIWDDDNGWIRLRTTLADYAFENDRVAEEGKRLGVLDFTSGWCPDGSGAAEDRNVDLLIAKP